MLVDVHGELRAAAVTGQEDRVGRLLKQGADVNRKNQVTAQQAENDHQNTALHLAVLNGHESIVREMMKYRPDLNAYNQLGQTALQLASMKGFIDIVRILTSSKARDLDHTTLYTGMTALHFASQAGEAEICQHLLDCGATEEIEDAVEKIPEYYAANEPTKEVFRKRKKPGTEKAKVPTKQITTQKPEPKPGKTQPEKPEQKADEVKPLEEKPEPQQPQLMHEHETPPQKTETKTEAKEDSAKESHTEKSPEMKEELTKEPKPVKSDAKEELAKAPQPEQAPPPLPPAEDPEPQVAVEAKGKAPEPIAPTQNEREAEKVQRERKPEEGERRPRDDWLVHRNKHQIEGGLNYNDTHKKMEFDHKKKDGNFEKVKTRQFEWSEGFKARQNQSVFDRLMGGGGKKKTDDKKDEAPAKKKQPQPSK